MGGDHKMNIYLKTRWNATLIIGGAFAIAVSLLLFIMPYLVTAQDSTASSALQFKAKPYVQQTMILTFTNTYTYYFPLVFQNYRVPTWQFLGLEGSEVRDIAVDPNLPGVLYAVTADPQGVFKSTDFGENWYQASSGLRDDGILAQVAVDPLNSSKIYATAFNYPRFYHSENGGQSWQPGGDIPLIPKVLSPHPAIVDRLFVGVGAWDVWGGGGWLCKSDDGGLNWTVVITQQVLAASIATSALDPSLVYVGGNGLYRSQDGGESFASLTSSLPFSQIEAVAIHPTNPLTAYVSTEAGIFKTNDGGNNWLWWSEPPSYQIRNLLINYHNPEVLYISSRNCAGIYISTDEGRHWHPINTGLSSLCVNDLEANEEFTHLYAATSKGVWILDLTDGGEQ
jgi:photosystem II stability/assembly factor-like uncharacterized protein